MVPQNARTIVLLAVLSVLPTGCSNEPIQNAKAQPANPAPLKSQSQEATQSNEKETANRPKAPAATTRLVDKTFDDIAFEMEKETTFERTMLTPKIEELSGKRIRIRGYILPTVQRKGIRQFVLVRDNKECCFGPGAALYDCIIVQMKEGESAEFSIRPVTVEGRFNIQEYIGPNGKHLAIFELIGESVR